MFRFHWALVFGSTALVLITVFVFVPEPLRLDRLPVVPSLYPVGIPLAIALTFEFVLATCAFPFGFAVFSAHIPLGIIVVTCPPVGLSALLMVTPAFITVFVSSHLGENNIP